MNKVLPGDILPAWFGTHGATITALTGGTNNDSYLAEHTGRRYLLRVYRHVSDPDRIRYEHRLLGRLSGLGLPFAIPAPLPASSGDTLVIAGSGACAALFPFLSGTYPDTDNPARVRACGAALAELDVALAALDLPAPAAGLLAFGTFPRVHPLAPDPDVLVAQLPLERDERRYLAGIMHSLQDLAPELASRLAGQIVHRDFDASNVLTVDGRISAVLDFEFARPDIRAIDLATGLAAFGGAGWDPAKDHPRLAFAEGYLARLPLTHPELEAMPELMLLIRAGSLLHRAARQQMGTASPEDVLARAQALLRRALWLEQHGAALVQALLGM